MSSLSSLLRKIGDTPGLRGPYILLRLANAALKDPPIARAILGGRWNRGFCSICDKETVFVERGEWLRDEYFCIDCFSIPRQRAIVHVLENRFPSWRTLKIHETSGGGKSSDKFKAEAAAYTTSGFMEGVTPGEIRDGLRCENLESLTFDDETFDLYITQDVFEHVLDPGRAFKEIARVLRPGGAHVFTIPLYQHEKSLVRSALDAQGEIVHLEPADYHGDPDTGPAWLVATEWGQDFTQFIEAASQMTTEIVKVEQKQLGLAGEFLEVFISRKQEGFES